MHAACATLPTSNAPDVRGHGVRGPVGCVAGPQHRLEVWNLLAGATDELQVVDAGVGAEMKRLMALEQEIWMQVLEG